jgi:glycerol kinase
MKRQVILAIDAGTTGNRVVAIDKAGEVVTKSYYEFQQHYPKPGWVEHDPKEIWETTLKALKDVTSEVGVDNVVSIGMTNQRETTILWDKTTGEPVYNAIVWQCRRTEDICNQVRDHESTIKELTGLPVDPYFSASKIKWILDNVEGARTRAENNELSFGTVETWLMWNLTGRATHATEPSNASRTMLFNIRSLEFDDTLLAIFDVPKGILPEVKDSDALFGHTDESILGKEIPIHGILGDQQASLFAHCGWKEGVVKNTYGTGMFVMTDTQNKIHLSDKLVTTVAWNIEGQVNYALEGSVFMGGATMQWLRDRLGIISSASESEGLATSVDNNEGIYFVPALQGLGAPYWRADARGLITGLTRKATKAHIVRAALESMAYQTRDVVEEMKKLLPFELKILSVDGGACVNNFLMQFQSDILGITVERPKIIETTALGAAGISGIASGFWTKDEFSGTLGAVERKFEPNMKAETQESYYSQWQRAVKMSLGD